MNTKNLISRNSRNPDNHIGKSIEIGLCLKWAGYLVIFSTMIGCKPKSQPPTIIKHDYAAEEKQRYKECGFEKARPKALKKAKDLNYHYIGELWQPENNSNMCSVLYSFYVKQVIYPLDIQTMTRSDQPVITDKVYVLKMEFRKIGSEFEYMGAIELDQQTGNMVRLN